MPRVRSHRAPLPRTRRLRSCTARQCRRRLARAAASKGCARDASQACHAVRGASRGDGVCAEPLFVPCRQLSAMHKSEAAARNKSAAAVSAPHLDRLLQKTDAAQMLAPPTADRCPQQRVPNAIQPAERAAVSQNALSLRLGPRRLSARACAAFQPSTAHPAPGRPSRDSPSREMLAVVRHLSLAGRRVLRVKRLAQGLPRSADAVPRSQRSPDRNVPPYRSPRAPRRGPGAALSAPGEQSWSACPSTRPRARWG